MLADREVRFLLADEVGLGKTIEAGLVMQSLLAMEPRLRVLILVPGSLLSQWFVELHVKFGGRDCVMLDARRLSEWGQGVGEVGSPFAGHAVICSTTAIEQLDPIRQAQFDDEAWDLVIVDECHRMQPDGQLYEQVLQLSQRCPRLLLLSATPGPHHADAYLALLHLLQPDAYPRDDVESFQQQWAATRSVAELLAESAALQEMTDDAQRRAQQKDIATRWIALLPDDKQLAELVTQWQNVDHKQEPQQQQAAYEELTNYAKERYQLDHRVIRHRRSVLAALADASGVAPLPVASRSAVPVTFQPAPVEIAVREAWRTYCQTLLKKFGQSARLTHWCLHLAQAIACHPSVLGRLLAMRAAVLEDPEEFAEYRIGAEFTPLPDLLRTDASDAEILTQIARSAACHTDAAEERPALQQLQQAQAAWAKQDPKRYSALLRRLKSFWKEYPGEKIVVFTSSTLAVEPLAEWLARKLSDDQVISFGGHQDLSEREENARRFQQDEHCHVMVSDPLGGEGRNLQFVSVVAHIDLPWSVAAVEQRIGRVDRLGRDGDVPSWIFMPDYDDAPDRLWASLLHQSVGVFAASSSGLELLAPQLETDIAEAVVKHDVTELADRIDHWQQRVAAERAADDGVVDTLYHAGETEFRQAAELAQSVAETPVPIKSLCRWLAGVGGHARRDDEHRGHYHLRARSADQSQEGVFDRDLALRHESLAFYAPGHHLIDQVIDDAVAADWCAATAWRRKPQPGLQRWEGLRAQLCTRLDLDPLHQADLPLSLLRRIYSLVTPMSTIAIVGFDAGVVSDERLLAVLQPGFDEKQGDRCLSQKVSRESWMRPVLGGKHEQVYRWQGQVLTAGKHLAQQAETMQQAERDRLSQVVAPTLQAQARLAAERANLAKARLGARHPDCKRLMKEAKAEQQHVDALLACVAGATVQIATASYVVVA